MANIQNVDQESAPYANHKERANGFYLPQTTICISKNKNAFLKDVVTTAARNKQTKRNTATGAALMCHILPYKTKESGRVDEWQSWKTRS